MKIVIWNVGRPSKRLTSAINQKLTGVSADIIVLTETNANIYPEGEYFHVVSKGLQSVTDGIKYTPFEIRVSVYCKYPMVNQHAVFNPQTALCMDFQTPLGLLTVYSTILGIRGGTFPTFKTELKEHITDFEKLFRDRNVCLIGDLNTTFTGRVYPSYYARQTLEAVFEKFTMINLTQNIDNCVDQIVISKDFLSNNKFTISTWNDDKKLSDHIGIMVDIDL